MANPYTGNWLSGLLGGFTQGGMQRRDFNIEQAENQQQMQMLLDAIARQQEQQDYARQQDEYQRIQQEEQRGYVRRQQGVNTLMDLIAMSSNPAVTPQAYGAASGAFGQMYPQLAGNIPQHQVPQPQPMSQQQILDEAAGYLTQGSGPANAYLSQAGYTGTMPQQQPPLQGNIPLGGLIPNWPGPTPGMPFNIPQPDKQVPFQFPATVNEGREERMGAKDKLTFASGMIRAALGANKSAENWNRVLPMVNALVTQNFGVELTPGEVQAIRDGIPELGKGYQQVATEAGTEIKREAQDLKEAQFDWKKQYDEEMLRIRRGDATLRQSRESRIRTEQSVGVNASGGGISVVGGKRPTPLQMQNLDSKYKKEAESLKKSIGETKTLLALAKSKKSKFAKDEMDDATRKQFINGYEAELNRMGDELTRLAGYRSQLRPYTMLKDVEAAGGGKKRGDYSKASTPDAQAYLKRQAQANKGKSADWIARNVVGIRHGHSNWDTDTVLKTLRKNGAK